MSLPVIVDVRRSSAGWPAHQCAGLHFGGEASSFVELVNGIILLRH
jgi:hypothetical protein